MWSRTCWGLRHTFFSSWRWLHMALLLLANQGGPQRTSPGATAATASLEHLYLTFFHNSSGIAEVLRELSLRILGMLVLQGIFLDFDTWPITIYTYIGSLLLLIPCLMHLCMCPVCPGICHRICQAFGQLSWQELCRVMEAHWAYYLSMSGFSFY